eukprot:40392_1
MKFCESLLVLPNKPLNIQYVYFLTGNKFEFEKLFAINASCEHHLSFLPDAHIRRGDDTFSPAGDFFSKQNMCTLQVFSKINYTIFCHHKYGPSSSCQSMV